VELAATFSQRRRYPLPQYSDDCCDAISGVLIINASLSENSLLLSCLAERAGQSRLVALRALCTLYNQRIHFLSFVERGERTAERQSDRQREVRGPQIDSQTGSEFSFGLCGKQRQDKLIRTHTADLLE